MRAQVQISLLIDGKPRLWSSTFPLVAEDQEEPDFTRLEYEQITDLVNAAVLDYVALELL